MASPRIEHPPERIAAAQRGDARAWRAIYDDLAPAVLGYLRLRGARDPEDLVGEVFLQVAQRIGSFEGSGAGFRSWVFTIAHHRLVDEHRVRERRPLVLVDTPLERPAPDAPDDDALAVVGTEQVLALVAQLTEDQRDVLLLRLVSGLTIEEIAGILGRSVGSTKQLQRRGLNAVRRLLESDDPATDVPR